MPHQNASSGSGWGTGGDNPPSGGSAIQPSDESHAISNGIQSYDTPAEMLESWRQRMIALADEVKSYGNSCVLVIADTDMTDGESGMTGMLCIHRGNYYTKVGLITEVDRLIRIGEV
jgi:hypothetical protein